jgi:hypothetical protein
MTKPRTASKEYRAAWREANRERYNEYAQKWRANNKAHLSEYIAMRRGRAIPDCPPMPVNIAARSCGRDFDPVACPLRHRAGLLKECRECKAFEKIGSR